MASKQLINLHLIAGQLCVWHADEVEILRREHHIVGSLIGALPGAPRQNIQLGLPLQLMPEEAAVLLQHGVGKLVTMSVAKPSKYQVKAFNQQRMDSIKEQKRLWQEHVLEQRNQLREVIEEGRRRKKEQRKKMGKELSKGTGQEEGDDPTEKMETNAEGKEKEAGEIKPAEQMKIKGDIGEVEGEGNDNLLVNEEGMDGSLHSLDEPIVEGENDRKEGMSCSNERAGNQAAEEEANGDIPRGDDREASRKEDGTFQDEGSNIARTRSSPPQDNGVPEEKHDASSEVKRNDGSERSPREVSECCADQETPEDCPKRSIMQEEEDNVKEDGCSVQLFIAEPPDSKFILEAPPSAWRYPSTEREILKYRVFRHFWEMGYYLTSGTKFGGDFLVYPGDPLLFHSYFIVVCIPYHKQLTPLELISHGRLGTFVKKAVVLCSVNNQKEVVCTSLQWAGIS
ncbi:tRNA-splicing endonuclease subunit Sen34-like [Lytechinus variegatus]|uniref:tRNA-splicing endonuclease subunit Sen34-like n=1 Tax=Lytechinus variegatus TaxID=7654 RepID=UPI001BB2AFD8|nr:tRNA-splicing endonuclease subunit Sen34-like [Lytechinus variegatus]